MKRFLARVVGRGAFVPFREHAEAVESTAEELSRQLRAWLRGEAVQADVVSGREHQADLIKRKVREDLMRARFSLLARPALLQLLGHQDLIADLCQDAALLMAQRRPPLGIELEDEFRALGEAISRTVHAYSVVIGEFDQAVGSGHIGAHAPRISEGVDRINQLEHESDLLERSIVATIYRREDMPAFDRYHLIQLVLMLGGVVDQVEEASGDLRMLLAGL